MTANNEMDIIQEAKKAIIQLESPYCDTISKKYLILISRLLDRLEKWESIDSAPKTGEEFIVRLPRQGNVTYLAYYDKIHKHFLNKGKLTFLHAGDLWLPLPPVGE